MRTNLPDHGLPLPSYCTTLLSNPIRLSVILHSGPMLLRRSLFCSNWHRRPRVDISSGGGGGCHNQLILSPFISNSMIRPLIFGPSPSELLALFCCRERPSERIHGVRGCTARLSYHSSAPSCSLIRPPAFGTATSSTLDSLFKLGLTPYDDQ